MENELMNQTPAHRFDQPIQCPLTCRERIELEYTSHFIPYLKFLEKKIGKDAVIESLLEFSSQRVKEYAKEVVQSKGKNDLSVFKEIFSSANPQLMEVLTAEVIEDQKDTLIIKVTECLLAEVFRKDSAADFGTAALCRDVLFTKLVNPQIELTLDGTLMEGKSCCLYRWYVKR